MIYKITNLINYLICLLTIDRFQSFIDKNYVRSVSWTTTSTQLFTTCYFVKFFCTPVNNFGDMLFQVLSVDRLGELSFQLPLPKVQRREGV